MILTDLISEYKYVYEALEPCNDYFVTANNLIVDFFTEISDTMAVYTKKSSPVDSEKDELIDNIRKAFITSYSNISSLVRYSYPLYGAMTKFENYNFKIPALRLCTGRFLQNGHNVIDSTNAIISAESFGMRTRSLLPSLILPLQALMLDYSSLNQYYTQFKNLDEILLEKIPSTDSNTDKYSRIELRSLKSSLDTDSFLNDLRNLSSFICQLELINTTENNSCKIYTQRIESGSLRIVWGSTTFELSAISDIIRALSDGIKMFRLTSSEKKLKNEEARTLKLQNDEKELAIINSQIDSVARITGLSSEDPVSVEKLQKLCIPLIRYLYSNPVGSIGNHKYDINEELKLIATTFNAETES